MPFLNGKPSWNKGLKIGKTHPQMGFQKGNKNHENLKSIATRFKKGISISPQTQFQKGKDSWNKGKKGTFKHTEEWKKQKREAMKGKNHPNWKIDRTEIIHNKYREYDLKNKEWVKTIKNRDGWKCKISNQDCSGKIYAHHILNWIDFPELRYQINNGITLCHFHHPRKWEEEKRLTPYFQELVSVSNEIPLIL